MRLPGLIRGWLRGGAAPAPSGADAGARIGAILDRLEAGDAAGAESLAREALAAAPPEAPATADLCHILGSLLGQRGALDEAAALLRRAVAAAPENADALIDLGNVHLLAGRAGEAVDAYRRAVALAPGNAAAACNLANALNETGGYAEAEQAARAALAVAPDHVEALCNLANACTALGRLDEAQAASSRALRIDPASPEARTNLGRALAERGRAREAIAEYRRALEQRPGFVPALSNLGVALQSEGESEEARSRFAEVLRAQPSGAARVRMAMCIPAIMDSHEHVERTRAELDAELDALLADPPRIDDPVREVGMSTFFLAYHGRDDRALQEKTAALYARTTPSLEWTAPHCEGGAAAQRDRIAVGFVSTFLHEHTIGHLMRGIVAGLDRARFEVVLLLPPQPRDALNEALRAGADRAVELPIELGEARRLIADERLDALFFTDIGMHPFTYFLAFARLAPRQFTTWGHPDTTGIPNVDDFLSCVHIEPPGCEAHYSERVVALPHMNHHYERLAPPDPLKPRAAFGLDPDANVYLCPQTLFKLHPDIDAVLAGILERDRSARVCFVAQHAAGYAQRLRRRFARTLGESAERVQFVPPQAHADYLNLAAVADVALDPLHFSGGRTTAEILATSTPVVTLPGEYMRGRTTLGSYRAIGVEDFVASSVEGYVDVAVGLATDRDRNEAARERLREAAPALYENEETIRQLERYLEDAVGR